MNYCHAFILCGLLASLLCVEGHAQTTTKRADTLVLRTRSATKKLVPGDSSAVITLPNQGGVLALEGSVSSLPVGTITTISKKAALPEGYLTCDGQAVSRTDYADLYASIGTTYGAGNGSTTFNVPKLIDPYVPRDGLVAWWPFNGNANDEWVRGYNATVYGPVLTTDRFSTPNAAYTFDGVNDYMVVQLLQHRSYTIAAWANHSAQVAQIRPVFQHKNNCSRGGGPIIELMYEQLRRYLMVCGECSANTCANVWDDGNLALLPVDQWHHLVLTSDGVSVVKMYANGVLVSTINDADASYSYGVQPFSIGKHQDDPDVYYLNGKVDDVGYWNRALSADEIEQLYESSSRFIIRATK